MSQKPGSERKASRRLRRFFSSAPLSQPGQQIHLSQDESHHVTHILRLSEGDACRIVDGSGQEAEAVIEPGSQDGRVRVRIENVRRLPPAIPMDLHLYVALPQKGKFDGIVEKAQELGAGLICPLETRRTVVKMTQENKSKTRLRWQKIAREAAKQSGSSRIMEIREPEGLEKALSCEHLPQAGIVLHPAGSAVAFHAWFDDWKRHPTESLSVWVGPEGGFEDEEVQLISTKARAEVVSLGASILKVDTAVTGVTAALRMMTA